MDMQDTWLNGQIGEDTSPTAERYQYFMRPEPFDDLGPIRTIDDELTGRHIKVRDMSIGMTRNAKPEDRKHITAYLEPYPHMRIEKAKQLQGWYKGLEEDNAVRPRPCFTEAILTEPYGGWCAVGCSFCYINSGFRGYRGTGLITVPTNYGEQIKLQLSKIQRGAAGYFSSFTDPFTPLEEYYHNTENAANEFVKVGLPIFFLSRLRYPQWAIKLMQQNPHSYAQKSLNTPDPEDWRRLSPGAQSLEAHFKEITKLRKAGIYVSIQVNPILPGVTSNEQILELFNILARAGANHVIVKFVEAGYSWAGAMVERTVKRFGNRGKIFEELFTENMGGQRTIQEEYRLRAHKLFSTAAKRLGLTYATCYEYKYERDDQGNITSKTGTSIGREFTTAEQCHGHRVPMYERQGDKFVPLEVCPPSGCLYCAEENDGPLCGDELAGKAKALKLVDLKIPFTSGNQS